MRGAATPEDILMFREIFDFNRNADSIRLIRDRVEKYEKLVRQQAEIEARIKLNNQKAKELDEAAKQLK